MSTKILETFFAAAHRCNSLDGKLYMCVCTRVYMHMQHVQRLGWNPCKKFETVCNRKGRSLYARTKQLFTYLIVRFFFWFCYRKSLKTLAELRPNSSFFLIGPRNVHYRSFTIFTPCFSICSGL